MTLIDQQLLRYQAYIDGQWIDADQSATFPVYNPATGRLLGSVADMGAVETRRAIAAAEKAFAGWRAKTAAQRGALLRKWYELTLQHADDLAVLLNAEQGKPPAEAKGEIRYGASFVEWFAEEAKRAYGEIIPPHLPGHRLFVTKQPVGVVGAITPWNFPNAMITRKVAPALAAGCTVVVKPSEETPFSALALAELAHRAGIPAGVFNVVTGKNAPEIGAELTANPVVRKISFTGSTAVGKLLMRQCADTVKKISLELGGNAPFIVFDDADIDAAVEGAMASKYRNAGQTCICANRLFVQSGVYDDFIARFSAAVGRQKAGVQIGPLINSRALAKVERLVQNAVEHGGRIVVGGRRADGFDPETCFYEPTVIADVQPAMQIMQEEIFGPVAPVIRFETENEVVAMANNTPYGLAAYFYGRDIGRVFRVAEALDYGMVAVNTGVLGTATAPFGGMKESGIGREGGSYGMDEFLEVKYTCVAGL